MTPLIIVLIIDYAPLNFAYSRTGLSTIRVVGGMAVGRSGLLEPQLAGRRRRLLSKARNAQLFAIESIFLRQRVVPGRADLIGLLVANVPPGTCAASDQVLSRTIRTLDHLRRRAPGNQGHPQHGGNKQYKHLHASSSSILRANALHQPSL